MRKILVLLLLMLAVTAARTEAFGTQNVGVISLVGGGDYNHLVVYTGYGTEYTLAHVTGYHRDFYRGMYVYGNVTSYGSHTWYIDDEEVLVYVEDIYSSYEDALDWLDSKRYDY